MVDRQPRLDSDSMKRLLYDSIATYKRHIGSPPTRVVIHKSSKFSPEELEGVEKALGDISQWDALSLDYSFLRLFRAGKEPPLRGTYAMTSDGRYHLFTRGFVTFQNKYWGPSSPRPLVITQHIGDTPVKKVCSELLGLTKMNWNTSAFSMREPITLRFARKIGGILAEAETKTEPKSRYLYYM